MTDFYAAYGLFGRPEEAIGEPDHAGDAAVTARHPGDPYAAYELTLRPDAHPDPARE